MKVIRKHSMMMFSSYSSCIGFEKAVVGRKLHRIDDVLNVETNKDARCGEKRGDRVAHGISGVVFGSDVSKSYESGCNCFAKRDDHVC